MASILRGVLLFLHVCLLTCSVWAKLFVTVPETVEVYKGDAAVIPVQYYFTEIQPTLVNIKVYAESPDGIKTWIYYGDDQQEQRVMPNTDYTNRIEVIPEGQHGFRLIIKDVQLSDDHRDFSFKINGGTAGEAEDRTSLRVFAPPEAPVIEGVRSAIPVTNEMPSKVASCEVQSFPKPNITWYRNNMPLTSEPGRVNVLTRDTPQSSGYYNVHSILQYKVAKEDNDATFSCEVIFLVPGGLRRIMSNSTNISVLYPTTMVQMWKESPQGLVKEGDTVELRCQGDGNPRPTFIFSREQVRMEGLFFP